MAQLDRWCWKESMTKKAGRLRAEELLTTGRDRTGFYIIDQNFLAGRYPTAYSGYVNFYNSKNITITSP